LSLVDSALAEGALSNNYQIRIINLSVTEQPSDCFSNAILCKCKAAGMVDDCRVIGYSTDQLKGQRYIPLRKTCCQRGGEARSILTEARWSRRAHNPQSGGSTELQKFGKSTPRYSIRVRKVGKTAPLSASSFLAAQTLKLTTWWKILLTKRRQAC